MPSDALEPGKINEKASSSEHLPATVDDNQAVSANRDGNDVSLTVSLEQTPGGNQLEKPRVTHRTTHAEGMPEKIGRYRVLRKLGEGGFGTVYLAKDDVVDRWVAIKLPRPDRLDSQRALQSFLREARHVARLKHSGIVTLYDCEQSGGQCYLVYEYIEGMTLSQWSMQGVIDYTKAAHLIAEIADVLQYAHGENVFHRDIKPGNILIDTQGRPHVTDFGLAVREEELAGERGRRSGTCPYISPEQVRGEGHRIDGRTDIYSLGAVLYELLCGRAPFDRNSGDVLQQIIERDPRPPRQIVESIPRELERICLKALSKTLGGRYTTAKDMADELRASMAPQTAVAVADTPDPKPRRADRPLRIIPKGLRSFGPEDSEFFLELLPGPRDRDGLPDSIRFWKTLVESRDPDSTFSVGLMYGPSGCGKSSLVKAGLLPRLDKAVTSIYVEATRDQTELRLAKNLVRSFPFLNPGESLKELISQLRYGEVPARDQKILIVIDQFEQWLHVHGQDMQSTDLLAALRQADGEHVQVLVLVRDDFWMSITRFAELLEMHLDAQRNTRVVDLFDLQHAQRVLLFLGQAFDRLPAVESDLTPDQHKFLDQAVHELSQDGRVISVRLSLFAELMKERPWKLASLVEVGGTAGIGIRFFEETFTGRSAVPDHRALEKPVRSLLQVLLPEGGTDIKGHIRSRDELAAACGLAANSPRFARLIEVLDRDLHIITPTESDLESAAASPDSTLIPKPHSPTPNLYQLTHDYLVPPLRQWLTLERRKTWRGRAELCLEERTAQMSHWPQSRYLPTLPEYLSILFAVPKLIRKADQKALLRAASHQFRLRLFFATVLSICFALTGLAIHNEVQKQRNVANASVLAERILVAEISQLPTIINQIGGNQDWVYPRLVAVLQSAESKPREKLRARLTMLAVDQSQVEFLSAMLLDVDPDELYVIREFLLPYSERLKAALWDQLLESRLDRNRRLRAACALALFDPENSQWGYVKNDLAAILLAQNPILISRWIDLLGPIKSHLVHPLRTIFLERGNEKEGQLVATVLAEYKMNELDYLIDLVKVAQPRQLPSLMSKLRSHGLRGAMALRRELAEPIRAETTESETYGHSKVRSNLAIALAELDEPDVLWSLLQLDSDPQIRSYLIDRLAVSDFDPRRIIERIQVEKSASSLQALLLCLGEYTANELPASLRNELIPPLLELYVQADDVSTHSAVDWLLRVWGQETTLRKVDEDLKSKKGLRNRSGWFMNSLGQTMAVFQGPLKFEMGSDLPEDQKYPSSAPRHYKRISRTFAIGTKEVTVGQFLELLPKHEYDKRCSPDMECPINNISWYDAARFCRLLSEREGIPEDEMCYPPIDQIGESMTIPEDFLVRTSYRLCTEAEREYACRGEVKTVRFYGNDPALLSKYGWFLQNSNSQMSKVGILKPNHFGLFDTLGNAWEWCIDSYTDYRTSEGDNPLEDWQRLVEGGLGSRAVLRGGCYSNLLQSVRSVSRTENPRTFRSSGQGIRVAKTIKPAAN